MNEQIHDDGGGNLMMSLGTNKQVKDYIVKLQTECADLHEQLINLQAERLLEPSFRFKAAAMEDALNRGMEISKRLLATLRMTHAAMGDIDILAGFSEGHELVPPIRLRKPISVSLSYDTEGWWCEWPEVDALVVGITPAAAMCALVSVINGAYFAHAGEPDSALTKEGRAIREILMETVEVVVKDTSSLEHK